MKDKKLISDSEIEKIMLASARALPDSPSEKGMRPAQIKKALSEPVRMLAFLINEKFEFLYTDGELTLSEMSFEEIDSLFNREVVNV